NANALQFAAKVREFDQLAGVVLHDRAITAEQDLYPPLPGKIEAMQRWLLEDCGRLLAMLPEIERTLASLRARALPVTAADLERDRQQHPRFAEWQALSTKVAALRRAQAVREGTVRVDAPALTAVVQVQNAVQLNNLAWARVAPKSGERTIYGE